ncbi:MAG: glycosyltransferase family 9 protein [Deltaproteobacteria bacterium]|nr:glycosyltransferase family 9 protein [Deltaproteobacteria bacterium]
MIRPILVLFPGSLGDLICALPAIESIAKDRVGKLVLAARGEALALASGLPFVEASFSLEGRIFSQLFSAAKAPSFEAQRFFSSFAEIISWYGHSHPKVVENLRALSSGNLRSFPFFSGQKECHAVGYYLQCLGKRVLRCPSLAIPKDAAAWGELYWREQGWDSPLPVLALHPGSGGKKKRWAPEGFRRIALWWKSRGNGQTLILLGPAETEELEQWKPIGPVAYGFSVWQIAALLSRATLYVGNDSGVSHLAGAVGGRGVVVFGPTRPAQWRPLGGGLQVVQSANSRKTLPFPDGIALDEVSVDQVIRCLLIQSAGE